MNTEKKRTWSLVRSVLWTLCTAGMLFATILSLQSKDGLNRVSLVFTLVFATFAIISWSQTRALSRK